MSQFLETLRTMNFSDVLRLLLILSPLVVAIWGAFRWAYGHRLRTLQTSLNEFRQDFERRVEQEKEEQEALYGRKEREFQEQVTKLEEEAEVVNKALGRLRFDFRGFHELSESPLENKDALWKLWLEMDKKDFHVREQRRRHPIVDGERIPVANVTAGGIVPGHD